MRKIVWFLILLLLFNCCIGCAEGEDSDAIIMPGEWTYTPPEVPIPPDFYTKESIDWERYDTKSQNRYEKKKKLKIFSSNTQINTAEEAIEYGYAILNEFYIPNSDQPYALLKVYSFEQDELVMFYYSMETRHLDPVMIVADYALWIVVDKNDGSLVDAWV